MIARLARSAAFVGLGLLVACGSMQAIGTGARTTPPRIDPSPGASPSPNRVPGESGARSRPRADGRDAPHPAPERPKRREATRNAPGRIAVPQARTARDRTIINAIPTRSLAKVGRIGWIYLLAASGDQGRLGMTPGYIRDGPGTFVQERVLPAIARDHPDFVLLHLPYGRGVGKDMQLDARPDAIRAGFARVADPAQTMFAGRLLAAAGVQPLAYVGTARNDPAFNDLFHPGAKSQPPALIRLVDESIGPLVDAGFDIVLDAVGRQGSRTFSWWLARRLMERGAFGGFEPRPARGTPWASSGGACVAVQTWNERGAPRGYMRMDPARFKDSFWAVRDEQIRGEVILLLLGKPPPSPLSPAVYVELLARGWSIALPGFRPPYRADQLRAQARARQAQIRGTRP